MSGVHAAQGWPLCVAWCIAGVRQVAQQRMLAAAGAVHRALCVLREGGRARGSLGVHAEDQVDPRVCLHVHGVLCMCGSPPTTCGVSKIHQPMGPCALREGVVQGPLVGSLLTFAAVLSRWQSCWASTKQVPCTWRLFSAAWLLHSTLWRAAAQLVLPGVPAVHKAIVRPWSKVRARGYWALVALQLPAAVLYSLVLICCVPSWSL